MYKLSLDLEEKLSIMQEHGLNAEEWLFIELLWLAEDGYPEYLQQYTMKCAQAMMPREILQSLKDKKVFDSSYKLPKAGEVFEPDQVEFSKTFINKYFKNSFEAGRELYNEYPDYLQGTNRQYGAKNVTTKGYMDENSFFHKYGQQIKFKVSNHEDVMDLLRWAKENELIQYSIVEYVTMRKWEDHRKMRESGEIGKRAFKVETLEDVD